MSGQARTIERDEAIMRTRRTAASVRVLLGALGIAVILAQPSLLPVPALGIAGFAIVLLTSLGQLGHLEFRWVRVEEAFAASAAILIVGCGDQRVSILSLLWLVALAAGVMARGGRVGSVGRALVLVALAIPFVRLREVNLEYAAFCVGVVGLQLTSGRLTLELNRLLRAARLDAENAETLLLAGDIASRVASREEEKPAARPAEPSPSAPLSADEEAAARLALMTLLRGEGLMMAVQPIVDVRSGTIHAHEALARFERRRSDRSPLHWFGLAEELGERVALERACLAAALQLFSGRPKDTRLSVNLSVAALGDPDTLELLELVADGEEYGLSGLIVEVTEETLVEGDGEFDRTIQGLRARGARLAVDDVGAGYSGLRQITAVVPDYLKLDRSLVAGIDHDNERAALVAALTGYADKVGGLLVAEGIEHASELECLVELGVPLAQGFHLAVPSRPWPGLSAECRETLRRGAPRELEVPGGAVATALLGGEELGVGGGVG